MKLETNIFETIQISELNEPILFIQKNGKELTIYPGDFNNFSILFEGVMYSTINNKIEVEAEDWYCNGINESV